MFNLLKVFSQSYDEWERNQGHQFDVEFLRGRVFEYTDRAIKEQFSGNNGPDFDALMTLPALFTYEGKDVWGSIGRITNVWYEGWRFEIMYTLPNDYPKIHLKEDRAFQALGMGSSRLFERHRTHWAVKDVDLFEVTTRLQHEVGNVPVVLPEERNVPIVLPEEDMSRIWGNDYKGRKLVFLSHRAEYSQQISDVRGHLENEGLRCFLAHEDVTPSTIWQNEILNALDTMNIFVGFVTDDFHGGGWPDQEVGYAYQRGVPRVFVKLADADPMGMVNREQALRADWDNAGEEIIDHLKQAGHLQ